MNSAENVGICLLIPSFFFRWIEACTGYGNNIKEVSCMLYEHFQVWVNCFSVLLSLGSICRNYIWEWFTFSVNRLLYILFHGPCSFFCEIFPMFPVSGAFICLLESFFHFFLESIFTSSPSSYLHSSLSSLELNQIHIWMKVLLYALYFNGFIKFSFLVFVTSSSINNFGVLRCKL